MKEPQKRKCKARTEGDHRLLTLRSVTFARAFQGACDSLLNQFAGPRPHVWPGQHIAEPAALDPLSIDGRTSPPCIMLAWPDTTLPQQKSDLFARDLVQGFGC